MNVMVSHYDCEIQHNRRKFNLLNVKQCTEASSVIQHAIAKARVYVRANTKRVEPSNISFFCNERTKILFSRF